MNTNLISCFLAIFLASLKSKLKSSNSMSQNIGSRPSCIMGATFVIQVQAGTKTLSPFFNPYSSLTAAINKKLAVLPDDTNNECLAPSHSLHSFSNCSTFSPKVNFFAVKVKYAIFNLSM